MMLEARQDLVDAGRGTVGKLHQDRDGWLHTGLSGAERAHFDAPARTCQVPKCEVEEMHRLLEDPRADAGLVIAPARRAVSVGVAEQGNVHVLRPADRTFLDQ